MGSLGSIIVIVIVIVIVIIIIIEFIIEDAMRRDTAAPSFWGSACRALFRWVVFAGLCLAIVWLILFDLV